MRIERFLTFKSFLVRRNLVSRSYRNTYTIPSTFRRHTIVQLVSLVTTLNSLQSLTILVVARIKRSNMTSWGQFTYLTFISRALHSALLFQRLLSVSCYRIVSSHWLQSVKLRVIAHANLGYCKFVIVICNRILLLHVVFYT